MIKNIYHLIVDHKIPTLSCSLAFITILNGGSFLFLYIILSTLFHNSFNDLVMEQIQEGKLKDLILYFFNYQNNLPYSIFLIGTSIYSSSSLYYHLMNIVELLTYNPFHMSLSKRILSVILTILFLLGFNFITLILTEFILFFNRLYQILSYLLLLIVFFCIIYFINCIAIRTVYFKRIYKGVFFTMTYVIFFTIGIAIYLSFFSNFKIVYGVLAFGVILFFYIYILCIGILMGIYINHKNINLRKLLKIKNRGGEKLEKMDDISSF